MPGDAEWTVLTDFLGPNAGYKMKTTSGWSTGNGDNSSSFNALPGGYRNLSGGFTYLGKTPGSGPHRPMGRKMHWYGTW